jgi:16S rRNA (uracil1498-N3)-methyltransferase
MTFVFDENIYENAESHILSFEESKHVSRVLRKQVGEKITITNGKGLEWIGNIELIKKTKTKLKLISSCMHTKQMNQVHLAIAPTKNISRIEWMLEKLTEIGVDSVTPIICYHSQRKIIRNDRLEKVIISALKQSQQFFLPVLNPMTYFNDYIQSINGSAYIAHCQDLNKKELTSIKFNDLNNNILIGPEGDFSSDEINSAVKKGITPVSLGSNRLRTETAGIISCHTLLLKQKLNNLKH